MVPLTVWNLPATNTAVPPGAAVTVVTSPPANTGAKLVSTTPVVGLNASSSLRFSVVPFEDLTEVNVPPTTTSFPTVAMPLTIPLRMLGVFDAGVAETTTDCDCVDLCTCGRNHSEGSERGEHERSQAGASEHGRSPCAIGTRACWSSIRAVLLPR